MLYLDTSAFLKLYVLEPGSETVQRVVEKRSDPLPVWEIQEMEFVNALELKVFWNEIPIADAKRLIDLFHDRKSRGLYFAPEIKRSELMADFRRLSGYTAENGCRTMDILHVACPCQLKPEQFISFDARQKKLAVHAGLQVTDLDAS